MSMHILLSIDPSIGRIEKNTLSQQTLMELFVEKIDNKEQLVGKGKESEDILDWWCASFDSEDNIIKINGHWSDLIGSIQLEWLPFTMQTVNFYDNLLTGTIELTRLPDTLVRLDLSSNDFFGTVNLGFLPAQLCILALDNNHLSGPLDLTVLPVGIKNMQLQVNEFDGETDFSQLPNSLEIFFLFNNEDLSGEIKKAFISTCDVRVHNTGIHVCE